MSLQFVFGNSGSGKSGYLYDLVLEQAKSHPEQNFLFLVPEQFTMETQRELVARHENHAIMNVDVLSFARLAYRVFDELGKQDLVVLEETGKNLVLRRVAGQKKKELRILGANMNKMGYIGEVKSLISELTQYNVSPEELADFLEDAALGEALKMKLSDILTLYRGFREYMQGRYITAEEVLSLLCAVAGESAILRGSVIVFDGFTGFTPLQNGLIRQLLQIADRVTVSVTMDVREDFYHSRGLHELFAMSKKMVGSLLKMAAEIPAEVLEPVVLAPGENVRYRGAPALFFLEQNLFRPAGKTWDGAVENISIAGLKDPAGELGYAAQKIAELVREKGYRYRDIALVTGDVSGYAHYVPEIFGQYGIPYFIDQTRNILFHPFIELIRSALEVVEYDFAYEPVFRFLRCGLAGPLLRGETEAEMAGPREEGRDPEGNAGEKEAEMAGPREEGRGRKGGAGAPEPGEEDTGRLTEEDTDRLENYVLARGIRGRKRWSQPWTFVTGGRGAGAHTAAREDLLHLNRVRRSIVQLFEPLCGVFRGNTHTVAEQTYVLYQFIRSLDVERQLKERERELQREAAQNQSVCGGISEHPAGARLAQEYAQIYRIVMDLLDKVTSLLGEETIPVREYSDILDAGFSAAKVGSIPPGNDRVTVGDIERTRLGAVRVLIFAGVNDGVVPGSRSTGGIISQLEREMMAEHHLELAPGAREKVFIQRFYLYLNMTKPSDALYLTYSRVGMDGKALRRSYLTGTLLTLFPQLQITDPDLPGRDGEEDAGAMTGEVRPAEPACKDVCGAAGKDAVAKLLTPESSLWFLPEELAEGRLTEPVAALARWYLEREPYRERVLRLFDAAFSVHTDDPVSRAVTRALYGTTLENSVTRLERFVSCAYAHFLNYGLLLRERELYGFAGVDMGMIYHEALERFAEKVRESEYTWTDLPETVQEAWVEESMEEAVLSGRTAGIFEEARNRAMLERMKATIRRTVWALIVQVKKGRFVPSDFEVSFSRYDNLEAIRFTLGGEEKMRLQGRIDRVDLCETEDKVYVKIIDYKSGNTSFSLLNLYHGLQLQLVVYLNAALELTAEKYPEKQVEPAGIFYYHVSDPMVEGDGTASEEDIRRAVLEQLKLNGIVNADPAVYRAMDEDFTGSSAVIPVALKADGTLKAVSKTVDIQEFKAISTYVNRAIQDAGRRIMDGDVAVQPYELDGQTGCDYCPYHTVCGFDVRLPGFARRRFQKFDSAKEILARIREEAGE